MTDRPSVLLTAGYFDWFSGYQEIGLTRALRKHADVAVLTGDRVSPIFSDAHLQRLGIDRRYPSGVRVEEGVLVKRVPVHELRSMVWSGEAVRAVETRRADLVVQVMPGQLLSAMASLARTSAPRVVLYGDNAAMYAALSPARRRLKFAAFAASKGLLYTLVNSRATQIFGYTPNTLQRLRAFEAGRPADLLPLAFDESVFAPSARLREETRRELALPPEAFVVIAPGKVQPQKRFDVLVDVVGRIRADGRDVRLVLAGLDRSPASQALRQQIADRGLSDTVIAMEFVPAGRLNALFNAADLGVWPAMPAITIQQAMGTGLRIVVPDDDLVRHLVNGGETVGRAFPPGGSLAATLHKILMEESDSASAQLGFPRETRAGLNVWLSTDHLARQVLSVLEQRRGNNDRA